LTNDYKVKIDSKQFIVTQEMVDDVMLSHNKAIVEAMIQNYKKFPSPFISKKLSAEYFETDVPILYPDSRRLPDGDFTAEVIGTSYDRSQKGNPMVIVEYEVVGDFKTGTTIKSYHVVREFGLVDWDELVCACEVENSSTLDIRTIIGSRLTISVENGWVRRYESL
jgi:hypothetical protein